MGCDACGTPHHLECFRYAGGCATYACGGTRAASLGTGIPLRIELGDPPAGTSPPEAVVVTPTRPEAPPPSLPGVETAPAEAAGSNLLGRLGTPPSLARRLGLGPARPGSLRPPALPAFVLDRGDRVLLDRSEVRLDLETPLERWVFRLLVVALVGLAVSLVLGSGIASLVFGVATLLAGGLVSTTDCTYVLDNRNRRLLYRRTVVGNSRDLLVAPISEVREVTVVAAEVADPGVAPGYAPALLLASGDLVALLPVGLEAGWLALRNAKALAEFLGKPYRDGSLASGPRAARRLPADGGRLAEAAEDGGFSAPARRPDPAHSGRET